MPWQRDFNKVLAHLRDMGFYMKLVSKEGIFGRQNSVKTHILQQVWDPVPLAGREKWKSQIVSNQEALHIDHILIPVIFQGCGIALAIISFIVEYGFANVS